MSYAGISVREAMSKLNQPESGWYLPQVQRQYVWGARSESETYVCLLLDSLLKRYPVGGIVLWETSKRVPHREFLNDYAPGLFAKQVTDGRWGAHKFLVYDGQQRLQTLRSVLRYTFNGRVLHFDVLFDDRNAESDETGFLFRDKDAEPDARYLKMPELVSMACEPRERTILETRIVKRLDLGEDDEILVKGNIGALWDVFVDTNIKSIAYFPVLAEREEVVNEVFRRLNTGGIGLNQIELVLSKIKAKYSDYEEKLWALAEDIQKRSGGIGFTSHQVLQFFHLLVKGTIRIDAERLQPADIEEFQNALASDSEALTEVFEGYLWGLFKINHSSIVPRWVAVLPIAAFLAHRKRAGYKWKIKQLTNKDVGVINRYFLLSQFCDWNTQTMVNVFAGLAQNAAENGHMFPLDEIRGVAVQKNRTDTLHYHQFLSLPWFATKILTPNRSYVFHEDKPQVDHIFPLALEGTDEEYRELVDVLWNFQPTPSGLNNYKRARHPREFFSSSDGAKFSDDYDFIPAPDSLVWSDVRRFIRFRHRRMRTELLTRYGLKLKRIREARSEE